VRRVKRIVLGVGASAVLFVGALALATTYGTEETPEPPPAAYTVYEVGTMTLTYQSE
jgi:hypothetical protein